MSDLLTPYHKLATVNGIGNKMSILPVENIVSPACVIPDTENPNKRAYFRVRPMAQWAELFEIWIHTDHLQDHTEPGIGE